MRCSVQDHSLATFHINSITFAVVGTDLDFLTFSGFAKNILLRGGEKLRQEGLSKVESVHDFGKAFSTTGGNLKAKHVIFVVTSIWNNGTRDEIHFLSEGIQAGLAMCNALNLKNVCIPAIGSGPFGYPPRICADATIKSVFNFLNDNTGSLKHIRFVNPDFQTVQVFTEEIDKNLRESIRLKRDEETKENSESIIASAGNAEKESLLEKEHPLETRASLGKQQILHADFLGDAGETAKPNQPTGEEDVVFESTRKSIVEPNNENTANNENVEVEREVQAPVDVPADTETAETVTETQATEAQRTDAPAVVEEERTEERTEEGRQHSTNDNEGNSGEKAIHEQTGVKWNFYQYVFVRYFVQMSNTCINTASSYDSHHYYTVIIIYMKDNKP
eukprot:TRINITY_DN1437_c0_g2_i1.p1 TRINITY_DN1437_c0_g2~~TRINITY_DN1437_c0_g2_i1.p1  ORF type:complete len:391 (+),score=74.05 TRINITY_DN1437_c0_g2_i1:10-1182(+)